VSKELVIASGKASQYVIVRGENAFPSEITAAEELQRYIKEISSADIPLITDTCPPAEKEILVGETNRAESRDVDLSGLGDDGFIIKTAGEKIVIAGGRQRGALYGVYELLEKYFGCGFYTEKTETVPHKDILALSPISEDRQIPVFEYRDVFWKAYDKKQIRAKRKINTGCGEDDIYGGSFEYAGYFVHSLNHLVPPEKYFEPHPEYYGLTEKGERETFQLCLTNPEVLNIATASVRKWLKENPKAKIVSVSQNDFDHPCLCPECKKVYAEENGAYSGSMIRFVNAVARDIERDFPQVKVDTLAYRFSRSIPKTKPEKNVIVRLCSIECCFSHPLERECPEQLRNSTTVSGEKQSFAKDIKDWNSLGSSLYIWDYTTNFLHYMMTFPNFGVLRQNVRFFADHNVKGVLEQGIYNCENAEFGELRAYLLSKLLWDPYMTEEEYFGHMDGFLKAYYGKGWRHIREYIDMAQELTKDTCFGCYVSPEKLFPNLTEAHPESPLPKDLTLDMIENYRDTDWRKYLNYYHAFKENPITEKGSICFEKALSESATEAQAAAVEKSALQVKYLQSYWKRLSEYRYVKEDMKSLILNFLKGTALEVSAEKISDEVSEYVSERALAEYEAFNADLYAEISSRKMRVTEFRRLPKEPALSNPPVEWDPSVRRPPEF